MLTCLHMSRHLSTWRWRPQNHHKMLISAPKMHVWILQVSQSAVSDVWCTQGVFVFPVFWVLMTNCVKLKQSSWQPWQAPSCLVQPRVQHPGQTEIFKIPCTRFWQSLTEFYWPWVYNVGGVCEEGPLEFVSLIHSPLGVCSCWLEARMW